MPTYAMRLAVMPKVVEEGGPPPYPSYHVYEIVQVGDPMDPSTATVITTIEDQVQAANYVNALNTGQLTPP